MKGPLDRTKVVLRHLPHTISQSALMEQIDARFAGRYNWFSFRSGKQSLKCQSYSRAYIDFKRPEDVIEFAEFYDGHVFVNEKGNQFKTIVEYAPSQRVPKQWSKKDGREGTIVKDPEYLEFLESVSKPVENLPSAEIQLERKEAERAGTPKEAPIVTPLMDFVRQKRAAKGGSRRSLLNGKIMRRSGASSSSSSSNVGKRGSEKRTSTMYVLREGGKSTNVKEKSTYVKRADRQASEKSHSSSTQSGSVVLDEEKGAFAASDTGKKKILLLKGKEKEIPDVITGVTPQQKHLYGGRQNQRHEASGRIIRSILVKDTKQNQSEQNQDNKDNRRPPRPQNVGPLLKDANGLQDDKAHDGEKQDKRFRNKEKPDRGVWTPLRRADGSHASDESLSSSTSQSTQIIPDDAEGGSLNDQKYPCCICITIINQVKTRNGLCGNQSLSSSSTQSTKLIPDSAEGSRAESKYESGSGRGGHFSSDNGSSHKHSGRRMSSSHNAKDVVDVSSNSNPKRGVTPGYGSHEKRVWVQKPCSGS